MKKVPENQLTEEIYHPQKGIGLKRWLLVFVLFVVTILWTFPFKQTVIGLVETNLAGLRACPISYSKIDMTWFAPGIIFDDPVVSGACFQKPGTDIALDELSIKLAGPNFSPLGIRFKILAKSEQTMIEAYPAIGIGQQVIRIADSTIADDLLNKLIGMDIISGKIQVDGLVELAQNQITSGKFKLESKQLNTNVANISGFVVPSMNLGAFLLMAETNAAGALIIDKLSIGSNDSTLAANFKGQLQLNRYNMLYSNADLTGEVRFSEDFFTALPLVKMLLQGKATTDGFYRLEIKGPLGQTRPNFL